ncbi:alpha-L-fucosidase [Lapillicoccus jejuensis]|uniref:alpha-L-fucosidase n=1 Tax=Lapillicoccus jejuensis TaxID=402171 RepID=A0A542E042_9MICO|nr:alpha-L-fucosidase [Lapillicoccus jejuensis]TQJ08731.1 alpha-L-fucosidase [Lapillicoccus jejuensis]
MTSTIPTPVGDRLRPTPAQLRWQQLRLGTFVHYGLNTFHGKEWSDGTLPPSSFDPTALDARQWARTAREAGSRYLVLTAKHHDGFCLWPTATTSYGVVSSPWRGGRGDLVEEVAQACADEGLQLGLYLSPWDRSHPAYADPAAYDEVYCRQLAELCTRYGALTELWFDGAGSEGRVYDWARIMDVVGEHQPDAMVFNMGRPTIRWAGNEDGIAPDPVDYVVGHSKMSQYTVVTTTFQEALYLPPECNVSLHRGWFWHPQAEAKTVDHLMAVWYRSVGRGGNLLLNVPPDTRGLVAEGDVERLREWTARREELFGRPVEVDVVPSSEAGDEDEVRTVSLTLPTGTRLDHLELREELSGGQRVTSYVVRAGDRVVAAGDRVGAQRVLVTQPLTTDRLEVELHGRGAGLVGATAWDTGGAQVPGLPEGYRAPTDYPED